MLVCDETGARPRGRASLICIAVFGAATFAAQSARAQAPASPDARCAALADLALAETTIASAVAIRPDPEFVLPARPSSPFGATVVTRPFCRVVGTVETSIGFEVWLPLEDWNRRFQGVGNGALAGSVGHREMARALAAGYATASTDTGHTGSGSDASWALAPDGVGRRRVEDWAHRSIHEMTVAAKAVTEAFYGRAPAYAYFTGCSTGGHQALTEAQRYPDDYDGILAGDAANHWTHLIAAQLWIGHALALDPATNVVEPVNKLPAIHAAALAACDAGDGVADGVIENPAACTFEPATMACPSGTDGADCLTPPQVAAVERLYGDVVTSDGTRLFPGLPVGSELDWSLNTSRQVAFAETFYSHLVFGDPSWTYASMDFDRDVAYAERTVGPIVDSVDPDLRAFRAAGGKLIHYHGWSDPSISAYSSIDYYESVAAELGEDRSRAAGLDDFYRLFLVPGMNHCRGGNGTDTFDGLGALARWVEDGVAPERIEASRSTDGVVDRTRPLCPYPSVARYDGAGETDDAGNFSCATPAGDD